MARPIKEGIDYFPLDTKLDTKFALIESEFGVKGFAIVVKLLQKIYGEHGYYCEWQGEAALLFARECGVGCNVVSEIVKSAIKRGIFDEDLYEKYQILTSKGIQNRYFEAVKRRQGVQVKNEYLLVSCAFEEINVDRNRVNVDRNAKNVCNNTQIKENKIKENKRKNSSSDAALAAVIESYEKNIGMVTPIIAERLDDWLKDVDLSLIIYAIEEAAINNKHSFAYINAVISGHFHAGHRTRLDAENAKAEREQEKGGNQNGSGGQVDSKGYDFSRFGTIL